MSAQRLSDRSRRRIERVVGVPVVRAWAHGGTTMSFVTDDHRHGHCDKATPDVVTWEQGPTHYTSCRELFPQDFE